MIKSDQIKMDNKFTTNGSTRVAWYHQLVTSAPGGVGAAHHGALPPFARGAPRSAWLHSHGPRGGDARGGSQGFPNDRQEVAMGQVRPWQWGGSAEVGDS